MSANQLKRLRKKRAKEEQRLMDETGASAGRDLDERHETALESLEEMYRGVIATEVVAMVFEDCQHDFDKSLTLLCEMAEQVTLEESSDVNGEWERIPRTLQLSSSPPLSEITTGTYDTTVGDTVEDLGCGGDEGQDSTPQGRLWASASSERDNGEEDNGEEWEQWDECSVGGSSIAAFVQSMFAHLEPGMVSDMLRESNEDVEATVENLLRASLVPDDETMSLQSVEDRFFGSDSGASSGDEDDGTGDPLAEEDIAHEDGDDDAMWQQWPDDLGWETLDLIAQQQEERERFMLDEYLLGEDTRHLRTSNVLLRTSKLAQLQDMFPEERRSTLMEYLNAEAGDMDRVVALIQSAPPSQQEKALRKRMKKMRKEAKRGKPVNVSDLHSASNAQLSSVWVGKDLKDRSSAIQGYHSAPSLSALRSSAEDNFPSLTSSPPPPSLAWTGGTHGGSRRKIPPPSYAMDEESKRKYEHLVLSYHWLDECLLEELFVVNGMSLTLTTTALSELYGTELRPKMKRSEPVRARGQVPASWKQRKAEHSDSLQESHSSEPITTVHDEAMEEEQRVPYCGPSDKRTRVPRVFEKIKKVPKDFQPVVSRGSRRKQRKNQQGKKAAHLSGSVRAGSEYRGQAMRHAQLRNEYYRNAARAFVSGDGKLAKELSQKGRDQARLMESNNSLAADHFFNSKNFVVSGMQHVDLHGMHLQEALDRVHSLISKYSHMDKSSRPIGLHFITGEGNHSVGGKPVIKPGLVQYLSNNGIRFRQHSGVVVVYL